MPFGSGGQLSGQIGTRQCCMGMSNNECPYRRYEQQIQWFMTGLESYRAQTIYATALNVLIGSWIDEIIIV